MIRTSPALTAEHPWKHEQVSSVFSKVYFNDIRTIVSEQSPAQPSLSSAAPASDAAEGNEEALWQKAAPLSDLPQPLPSSSHFTAVSLWITSLRLHFGTACWSPTSQGVNELLRPNQACHTTPLASVRRTGNNFKGPADLTLSLWARAAPFSSLPVERWAQQEPTDSPYMAPKAQFPLAQAQAGWKNLLPCYSAHPGLWKASAESWIWKEWKNLHWHLHGAQLPGRGKAMALATSWITSNTKGEMWAQQPIRRQRCIEKL